MNRYNDIINLPHHISAKRPRMSQRNRAAQFSPFAALSGYEDAVRETARLTEERRELSEDNAARINESLLLIRENIRERPWVSITCFVPDKRKSGGEYVTKTGQIRHIDEGTRALVFADNKTVPIADIYEITFIK